MRFFSFARCELLKTSHSCATMACMARKSSKRRSSRRLRSNGLEVAETILQQMGGARRLKAMIGAYDFLGSEKDRELQFKWKAKARNGAKAITISLDPSDTYTLKFWKIP